MLKNEDTIGTAEEIIKKCLESNDLKLKANTIALLTDMLDSENTDEYEVAQTLLERNGELVDKIQGVLSEMLDNEDTKDNAIKILNNAFEGATKDKEDFFENKISHKKGFLVKNLDNLTKIEEDSSTELLLKKMFNKDETRDLTIKVLKYLDENSSYTQELREHFYNVNENSDSEVLDQEEVLGKD